MQPTEFGGLFFYWWFEVIWVVGYLLQLIEKADKAIKTAPEGTLIAHTRRNSYQYYHRKEVDNTHGIYIPKKKIITAKKLAEKDYWERIKDAAIIEFKALEGFCKKIGNIQYRVEDIYSILPSPRQALLTPIWYPDEEYKAIW